MKLVSGSMIAQFFGILLFPIISRIYSPDDFGVFQLFLSISSIVAIISCLTYHLAIMLPKKNEDSANIVSLCFILLAISSVVSGFIFIPLSDEIAGFLNTPELADYLILLPVVVFLSGLFNVLNYWSSRRVRFGVVAESRIANTLGSRLSQVGIGSYNPSPVGLISGYFTGFFLANLLMLGYFKSDIQYFRKVSIHRMKELAIRYKRFPKFSMWSLFANTLSFQLPPFMLAFYFTSTTVGHYSFANQILALPVSLIGGATSQVFFQKASEVKNKNGNFTKLVGEVHRKLILIGAFPLLVFMIVGEDLFTFFLGAEWYSAGIYAKILAPWLFIRFMYSPISSVFDILEKQNIELLFNILIICSIFVTLFIGGSYNDPIFGLILLSGVGVILWSSANFYLLKISGIALISEVKYFIKYLCVAILVSIPLVLVNYFSASIYAILITSMVLSVIYYGVVIYQDPTLRSKLLNVLKSTKK
ncbi:oligosaccharide flippase family protein [Methanococcoides sp. AM1]|uniref:oligosaccharide flippase family protein n=1 Tax=Methanococcoides sp. AM1 TaxID=1201011 RepID=UPI001082511B|nr:oligosaccharide flippase family protein [Methanococcoides sp. AM1]